MSSADASHDVVSHFVTRARKLYSLPAVALRVLELTDQPTVDTQALTDCIEKDPALTTKILRVVNSSVFGLAQRVGTLKQAIAMLGTRRLKMLVLCFSLPSNLACGASAEVLGHYWRHTVFKAIAAREIAEVCYDLPGEEAFVGGLLQNLGILVLIQDLGSSYEKFLQSIWTDGGDLVTEEIAVLGFDHKFLSARLLEHWKLPQHLVEAIRQPQNVDVLCALDVQRRSIPQVLHLAELVATFLVEPRPPSLDELLQVGHRYRGLTMSQLEALMASLEAKVPQLAEVLSFLELPGGTSYSAVLLDAYRQLAEVLDDATAELLSDARAANEVAQSHLAHLPLATNNPLSSPACASHVTAPPLVKDSAARAPERVRPTMFGIETDASEAVRWGPNETSSERSKTFSWLTRDALIARISTSVGRCRQTRSSLSLLLVDLDDVGKVAFYCGVDQLPRVIQRLGVALCDLGEAAGNLVQIGDARFAIVLDGCDRSRGVTLAWRIVDGVRIWKYPAPQPSSAGLSVSVGLATLTMPPRNFPAEELLTAAERCLSGVQLSGGDGVKSIDIY